MNATCLSCGLAETEAPLLPLVYEGKSYHICPQCLPLLIHNPSKLAGKLPHAERLGISSHSPDGGH